MASDRGRPESRTKDGREWRIGSAEEVRWIDEGTSGGVRIVSAIPPVFEAYATLEHPLTGDRLTKWEAESQTSPSWVLNAWKRHETAVLGVLTEHTEAQPWWLGYLETGSPSEIVFNDAPKVRMYANWGYVLVEAGPEQAARWREEQIHESLPDLMFPADRSWLVSTLWDDDWTCIGGPRSLIDGLSSDPVLRERARVVDPSMKDTTPPGHVAY
jgi:hypothetical protein